MIDVRVRVTSYFRAEPKLKPPPANMTHLAFVGFGGGYLPQQHSDAGMNLFPRNQTVSPATLWGAIRFIDLRQRLGDQRGERGKKRLPC
jgi:hypothetical protein